MAVRGQVDCRTGLLGQLRPFKQLRLVRTHLVPGSVTLEEGYQLTVTSCPC
jgi:hypothetical protein